MAKPDPRDETHWSRVVAESASNPLSWLMSADALRRSSDALRSQWEVDTRDMVKGVEATFAGWRGSWQMPAAVAPAMMMLLGLCLENLAKGLVIARNSGHPPFTPVPGARLDSPYKSHSLINLLTKQPGKGNDAGAGVVLGQSEREQVDRLEVFVLWGGRYPVPVAAMDMHHVWPDRPPTTVSTDDLKVIDPLLDRVRAELETAARAWAADQAAAAPARQSRQWTEALAKLAAFPTLEADSVIYYVDASATDSPGCLVMCLGCHKSFTVSARIKAALCPCGSLSYFEEEWAPTQQQMAPKAITLRAENRPA